MLITELGAATTILIGVALGFISFAISIFWLQLFGMDIDSDSKCFMPLLWIHLLVWTVGICVAPYGWMNDNVKVWAIPFMIYFFGSIFVMFIVRMFKSK